MNLSTHRIWCYLCENEVFLSQRNNINHNIGFAADSENHSADSTEDDDHSENEYSRGKLKLVYPYTEHKYKFIYMCRTCRAPKHGQHLLHERRFASSK